MGRLPRAFGAFARGRMTAGAMRMGGTRNVRLDERLVDKVREMCGADAVEVVR